MEFFRKGFDPPPYFWTLWNQWGTFQFWSQKGEELNFPKTSIMAILNINSLLKVPKSNNYHSNSVIAS